MKLLFKVLITVIIFAQLSNAQSSFVKETAITFDDLPVAGGNNEYNFKLYVTNTLVGKLKELQIPAIGFVNEIKLYKDNEKDERSINLLKIWVDAGLELGNHTYSHPDFHKCNIDSFILDFLKGEEITKTIYKPNQSITRYFRHPFLHTGTTLEARHTFEKFLAEKNYAVAPVTIDNSDWIFSLAYDKSIANNDSTNAKKIAEAYIPYMLSKFEYFERNTIKIFNRPIKQILLLHANRLNADYIDKLAEVLKINGYNFISLKDALTDSAYKSTDTWVGKGGISWIDRWALSKGFKGEFFKGEPTTPPFILKIAGVDSE